MTNPAADRKGERYGWLLGFSGGFIWVLVLAVIGFVKGMTLAGTLGLVLAAVAITCIALCAPWRHPDRPWWMLMLPIYVLLAASLFWAMVFFGSSPDYGLSQLNWFVLLPAFLPFFIAGTRRWNDLHNSSDPGGK